MSTPRSTQALDDLTDAFGELLGEAWRSTSTTKSRPTTKTRLVSVLEELEAGRLEAANGGWRGDRAAKNCRIVADARFRQKNLALACVLVELLAQNQPDTVRGTMYAAVSCGWLPDTGKKSYGRCQRLLNELRLREVLPFSWVVDNIRSTEKPSSWSGLADFADTVRDAYRRDFWASLPEYVCIIVEKDTVAGRIAPVTREFDVPLHPLRGFSSTSFAAEIGATWKRIEKPITAYYIGDHDPSGRDIERSIRERLSRFSGRDFTMKRLAVEPEHFDQYNIIPLDPKKKDTRYAKFVEKYGPRCAEVEAIPANDLRDMVEGAIRSHIPTAEWQRLQNIEEQERQTWQQMLNRIGGAK
jgi:hypothetical protein